LAKKELLYKPQDLLDKLKHGYDK